MRAAWFLVENFTPGCTKSDRVTAKSSSPAASAARDVAGPTPEPRVGFFAHRAAGTWGTRNQSADKYTIVQTATAEHLIRTPIVELAAQLDPQRFVQVHRSTLVNLEHLAGTRRDEASRLFLRLRGWAGELPVSRAYVHLFKAM